MMQKFSLREAKPILTLMLVYAAVSVLSQTLLFTIITYLVSAAGKSGVEFGNTVNEIADQYRLFCYAVGLSVISLTIWRGDKALYRHIPFWNDHRKGIWQLDRSAKDELLRGASSGLIAATVYLMIFTFSRQISFLGTIITSSFGTPVFPLFFLDLASLVALVFCDEYIFRHKILRTLASQLDSRLAVLITSTLFTAGKHLQFSLSGIDYLNLFCFNLALCFFYLKTGKAHRGLGFLSLLLATLHPIAGLPLWNQDSPSFFLFKTSHRAAPLLSGGGAGPLGGLGLFSILLAFAFAAFFSWQRGSKAAPRREAETQR